MGRQVRAVGAPDGSMGSAAKASAGPRTSAAESLARQVRGHAAELIPTLVAFRRDMHAHPELGYQELRATKRIAAALDDAGLSPRLLPGTGVLCDIDPPYSSVRSGQPRQRVALRADIDALPIPDTTGLPYGSTIDGVAHACGHDIHTAVVLGAGLVLGRLAAEDRLTGPVRLVFQPAEEIMPGGSHGVIDEGGLADVGRILCVHTDPRIEVGRVGLRAGPVTSASDRMAIRLTGSGGHTARPHLTQDLVLALGALVSQLPVALGRRLDPRAGVNIVFGRVAAGHTANVVPVEGVAEGTVRCLDLEAWEAIPGLVEELATAIVGVHGVTAEVNVFRGTPPVMNDPDAVAALETATRLALGDAAVAETDQSLGAEDFAWYLEHVPGALARLGVRRPGDDVAADLHQGTFDPDEDAIGLAMRLLAAAVLLGPDVAE